MPQIPDVVKTLKRELKTHNVTYADVAKQLKLSEASVKRMFAEEHFTLERLEAICSLAHLEMTELFQLISNNKRKLTQLTQVQEQKIAEDPLMLLITVCVINGHSYQDILSGYKISESECIQKLAALDRLKIIELLPKNRVKLLITPNFSWIPNGPIQQFFKRYVEKDFFNSRFDRDNEKLIVLNSFISQHNNKVFQEKMDKLGSHFTEMGREDSQLPLAERQGTTVVIAMRHSEYDLFKKFMR